MKEQCLIVSHDAGGAELLSAWSYRNRDKQDNIYIVDGPAVKVFQKRLPDISVMPKAELPSIVFKADRVVTSTSFQSDLERTALRYADEYKKPSASILDHWINYDTRFGSVLPDEIWVVDEYAYDIATRCFKDACIMMKRNYYFEEITQQLKSHQVDKKDKELCVLYLTQPINLNRAYLLKKNIPVEINFRSIFQRFRQGLQRLNQKEEVNKVFIRVHPAENVSDYVEMAAGIQNVEIHHSHEKDLVESCLSADYVVGAFSMAMVVALNLGCSVSTCVPDVIEDFLPHKNIANFIKH